MSSSYYIGDNISKREKEQFLIQMVSSIFFVLPWLFRKLFRYFNAFVCEQLTELKDSKEAVYGSLDAWVAWEQNFPIAMLKRALLVLERKHEWHRVIQVSLPSISISDFS